MSPGKLAVPGYVLALCLLAFPAADVIVTAWPLRPGDAVWRFRTVSLASRTLVTPLMGLLLAGWLAGVLEQRWALRAVATLSGLLVLALLGAGAVYGLDALQMRGQVGAEERTRFYVALGTAVGKIGLAIVFGSGMAVASWRTSRSLRRSSSRSASDEGRPPIVAGGTGD